MNDKGIALGRKIRENGVKEFVKMATIEYLMVHGDLANQQGLEEKVMKEMTELAQEAIREIMIEVAKEKKAKQSESIIN